MKHCREYLQKIQHEGTCRQINTAQESAVFISRHAPKCCIFVQLNSSGVVSGSYIVFWVGNYYWAVSQFSHGFFECTMDSLNDVQRKWRRKWYISRSILDCNKDHQQMWTEFSDCKIVISAYTWYGNMLLICYCFCSTANSRKWKLDFCTFNSINWQHDFNFTHTDWDDIA